jgi:DnaJ-class molecular chaperone
VNTYQALKTLNVDSESSFEEIKVAYRKLALEVHPDRNTGEQEGIQFKRITEAYNTIKKYYKEGKKVIISNPTKTQNFKRKPQWGAPPGQKPGDTPEEDWGRFTREFEEGDPEFWKSYETNFGKNIMLELHLMEEMESLTKPKNQKFNQIYLFKLMRVCALVVVVVKP